MSTPEHSQGRRPPVLLLLVLWLLPSLAACGVTGLAPTPEAAPTFEAEPTAEVAQTAVAVETVVVEVEVTEIVSVPTAEPGPTSTALPTAAPTAVPPGVAVQQELERLTAGRIAYNPPSEMTVEQPERVEVRISLDASEPLTAALKGVGAPVVEPIPVSCFMRVRLVGESFHVVPFSSEEQVIPAHGFAEWAWDVTPVESGERTLALVVTALVKTSDAEGTRDLPIIERQIHVKVNPGHLVSSFLSNSRGWIYPAVLVPLAAALGRWLWGRRQWGRPGGTAGAGPGAASP